MTTKSKSEIELNYPDPLLKRRKPLELDKYLVNIRKRRGPKFKTQPPIKMFLKGLETPTTQELAVQAGLRGVTLSEQGEEVFINHAPRLVLVVRAVGDVFPK